MLVIDASVAITAALDPAGFRPIADRHLVAPRLLWSEACSILREMSWRAEISPELGRLALDALLAAPIRRRDPPSLPARAWRVAETLGWAKTYDAEYVALAQALACPLLTRDARLQRGVQGLVPVLGPGEL